MRLAALLLMLSTVPVAMGETYTVYPDGSGDFLHIQHALDWVFSGDTVELADGVFSGEGNRELDFHGKGIVLRSASSSPGDCVIASGGGYVCMNLSYATDDSLVIQDIGISGFAFAIEGYSANPVIRGCDIYQCDSAAIGSFAHLRFEQCSFSDLNAGAVSVSNGVLEIEGCEFEHIFQTCIDVTGELTIKNSVFTSLSGELAIRCDDVYAGIITGCHFAENARCIANPGGCLIEDCEFLDNWECITDDGGGTGGTVIEDCDFTNNQSVIAYEGGGGLQVYRCAFYANNVEPFGSDTGGAIQLVNAGSILIGQCSFQDNVGRNGAAIRIEDSGSVTIDQCLFLGNQAEHFGGAIYLLNSDLVGISHCTLVENSSLFRGAGIVPEDSSPTIDNCVIAFSTAERSLFCYGASYPVLTCCDIYGNAGGDWTGCIASQEGINGNITLDPGFCDLEGGDFTLYEDSPCAPFMPPNTECDLIGAFGVGCSGMSTIPDDYGPTQSASWGEIKARFR